MKSRMRSGGLGSFGDFLTSTSSGDSSILCCRLVPQDRRSGANNQRGDQEMEALGPHLPGPGAPSRTVAAGNGAVPPVDVRGTRRMFLIVEDVVEVESLQVSTWAQNFNCPVLF